MDMTRLVFIFLIMIPCLARLCYTDIKERKLEHLFIIALLPCAFLTEASLQERAVGMLLPLALTPFLGFGDVLLLCALGVIFGAGAVSGIFAAASLCAGALCLTGLALKQIKRDDELPFAPFIAFGCLVYLIGSIYV